MIDTDYLQCNLLLSGNLLKGVAYFFSKGDVMGLKGII